jgi:hypothetical protein
MSNVYYRAFKVANIMWCKLVLHIIKTIVRLKKIKGNLRVPFFYK